MEGNRMEKPKPSFKQQADNAGADPTGQDLQNDSESPAPG